MTLSAYLRYTITIQCISYTKWPTAWRTNPVIIHVNNNKWVRVQTETWANRDKAPRTNENNRAS